MAVFKWVQGGMVVFKGVEEVMFIDLRTAAAIERYLEEWMAEVQGWRETRHIRTVCAHVFNT